MILDTQVPTADLFHLVIMRVSCDYSMPSSLLIMSLATEKKHLDTTVANEFGSDMLCRFGGL